MFKSQHQNTNLESKADSSYLELTQLTLQLQFSLCVGGAKQRPNGLTINMYWLSQPSPTPAPGLGNVENILVKGGFRWISIAW